MNTVNNHTHSILWASLTYGSFSWNISADDRWTLTVCTVLISQSSNKYNKKSHIKWHSYNHELVKNKSDASMRTLTIKYSCKRVSISWQTYGSVEKCKIFPIEQWHWPITIKLLRCSPQYHMKSLIVYYCVKLIEPPNINVVVCRNQLSCRKWISRGPTLITVTLTTIDSSFFAYHVCELIRDVFDPSLPTSGLLCE